MPIEQMGDPPPSPASSDFLDRLRLTQVDRDIFTGWCHAGSPLRAFGGQVAAQALVAAGETVPGEERRVHSLHAYFLRPGRTSDHIVYLVDRPRDGRSFTTRRVRAVQFGEVIFTMSVSFAIDQRGPAHQSVDGLSGGEQPTWWSRIPHAEDLAPEQIFEHIDYARDKSEQERKRELAEVGYPEHQVLDLRVLDPAFVHDVSSGRVDNMIWVRTPTELTDSQIHHVCALTYFSDLTLVSTVNSHHGGRRGVAGMQIASLDHAMWFHNPFRADDWLLFATDSPISGHGHGFARGQFLSTSGVLVASAAQETLLRDPPGKDK